LPCGIYNYESKLDFLRIADFGHGR
jgi:hypothetical protein